MKKIVLISLVPFLISSFAFAQYSRYRINVLYNGGFEEFYPDASARGAWWLSPTSRSGLRTENVPSNFVIAQAPHSGTNGLQLTRPTDSVYQFLNGVQEYSDSMHVNGFVRLDISGGSSAGARLVFLDRNNRELCYIVKTDTNPSLPANDLTHYYRLIRTTSGSWQSLSLAIGKEYKQFFGDNPKPPIRMMFTGTNGKSSWDDFSATTDIYTTSRAQLQNLILDEVKWIIDNWLTHGSDNDGPMATTYINKTHDAITGQIISPISTSTIFPIYYLMQDYIRFRNDTTYRGLSIRAAQDMIKAINPTTKLQAAWDSYNDVRADGNSPFGPYLLNTYALTHDTLYLHHARDMMQSALAFSKSHGLNIPQEYFPGSYNSATGAVQNLPTSSYHVFIRWFDLITNLLEVQKYEPHQDFIDAAIASAKFFIRSQTFAFDTLQVSTYSFTPTWYSWDNLDPAFDDYFGYDMSGLYNIQAATNFADNAITGYIDKAMFDMEKVWREALHRGGNCASDQNRGWQIYLSSILRDSTKYSTYKNILALNAWNMFKGSQGPYGVWNGVTFKRWQPQLDNPFDGATKGPAGNLVSAAYNAWKVNGQSDDFFAMIVTAFRASQLQYKKQFGYLRTPEIVAGNNPAGGEFRYIGAYLPLLEEFAKSQMSAPILFSPKNASMDNPTVINFIWDAVTGADSYHLQLSSDNAFTQIFYDDATVAVNSKVVGPFASGLQFFWRVRAKNNLMTTGWSNTWSFTTVAMPPSKPVLVLPVDGANGVSIFPTFLWNASLAAQAYRLQIASDSAFINLVFDDSTITVPTTSPAQLQKSTKYFWRVRAMNSIGISAWSDVWSFTTISSTLTAPLLRSPVNGAIDVPATLMLEWNAVAGASTYHLQVASDNGFNFLLYDDSLVASESYQLTILQSGSKYHWRVRARNSETISLWSDVWSFTTANAPLYAPMLYAPPKAATNIPVTTELRWYSSSGATKYHVQLATDAAFSNRLLDDSLVTTLTRSVTNLQNNVRHYWRVRAMNDIAMSLWSEVWSFTTVVPLPEKIQLITPRDSAVITTKTTLFTWRSGMPNVDRYWMEYSLSPAFANPVIDSALTDSSKLLRANLPNDTYWWRVRAHNDAGWGEFSERRMFNLALVSVDDDQHVPSEPQQLFLYPNPVRGQATLTLQFTAPESSPSSFIRIKIYNSFGEEVDEHTFAHEAVRENRLELSLAHLPNGFYYCSVLTGKQALTSSFLIYH